MSCSFAPEQANGACGRCERRCELTIYSGGIEQRDLADLPNCVPDSVNPADSLFYPPHYCAGVIRTSSR